jgi:hypothetical protein
MSICLLGCGRHGPPYENNMEILDARQQLVYYLISIKHVSHLREHTRAKFGGVDTSTSHSSTCPATHPSREAITRYRYAGCCGEGKMLNPNPCASTHE